jgi:hypothetical protein
MKAESRKRRISPAPLRSQEVAVGDRVLDRIRTITGELETLQADLNQQIRKPQLLTEVAVEATGGTSLALGQFKAALDRLRQVLWSYLEQVPEGGQQAAEDFRALRGTPALFPGQYPSASLTPSSAPVSFFDRLDVVIDAYMKKNEPPTPPERKRTKT